MCGIVGYTGCKQAAPIILSGLTKLEYRGYDSAGLAVMDNNGKINISKAKGKLAVLKKQTGDGAKVIGSCGIGHTRWATHGEPTKINAHPHSNAEGTIVAVHNGIIENFAALKEKLLRRGYEFYSETDTEVATKLVDYYYKKHGDPLKALSEFALHANGSYALAVLFKEYSGEIFAIRKDSPMVIGYADGGAFLASDVPAILNYTRNIYYNDNYEIARLSASGVVFYNLDGEAVTKKPVKITWDAEAAEKGGWEHFMLKEIHEQPSVLKNTYNYFVKDGDIDLSELGISDEYLKGLDGIIITGCGSAYHVGMVAQYVLEDLVRIPVRVDIASELRYRNPVVNGNQLLLAISQSGETADTLAAMVDFKKKGVKTLAMVNVVGSQIAREADCVFYTKAGPEISVATTKAYSAQLLSVYLFALKLAKVRGTVSNDYFAQLLGELEKLPQKLEKILGNKTEVQKFAAKMVDRADIFFIGRGIDYAVSLESSLKLKEVSYIHSEAYGAGELKHGPISLIEKGTLVFGTLTQGALMEKTVSNLLETATRGAYVAVIVNDDVEKLPRKIKKAFKIPTTDAHFSASLSVVVMQLFSYYVSVLRGNDVDKPRNLAKSVSVE